MIRIRDVDNTTLYTLQLPDESHKAVILDDIRQMDSTWMPTPGDPVRWSCSDCMVETVNDDGTCTVSTGNGDIHKTSIIRLTKLNRRREHKEGDMRGARDARQARDENSDADNNPLRYTGPRDRSYLAYRRSTLVCGLQRADQTNHVVH